MGRARFLPDFSVLDHLLPSVAEAIGSDPLRRVVAALPDQEAATDLLNDELAALRLRLSRGQGDSWLLRADHGLDATVAYRNGVLGLARLVELDGWSRLKRCQEAGCDRGFIDLTNGALRKYCDPHRVAVRRELRTR